MSLETITSVIRTETSLLPIRNKEQLKIVCSSDEIASCVQQRLMNASELDTSFKRFLSRFVKFNFRIRFKQCADGHYLVCETFWILRRLPAAQIKKQNEETASILKSIYSHHVESSEEKLAYKEAQETLQRYISEQSKNSQCLDHLVMYEKLSSLTNSSREKTDDTYTYYSKIASLAIKAGDHNLSLHGGNQNPTANFENQEYIKLQSDTNQEVVTNDTAITNDMSLENAAVFYKTAIKILQAQKDTHASTDIDGNVVDWKKFADAALSYDASIKRISRQINSIEDMSNTEDEICSKKEPLSDVYLEKLDTAIECYHVAIKHASQHTEDSIYQKLCVQRAEAELCKARADKRLSAMDGIALCNRVISFYNSRRDEEQYAASASISVEDNNKFDNELAFAYRTRGFFQFKDYQNYTYDADNCYFEKLQHHKTQKLRIYNDACDSFNKSLSCAVEPSILRTTYCQMVTAQIQLCYHKDVIKTCTKAIKALQDLSVGQPALAFFYYHRVYAHYELNLKKSCNNLADYLWKFADYLWKFNNKSNNNPSVNDEIDKIVNSSLEGIADFTFVINHSDNNEFVLYSLYFRGIFYCLLGRYQEAKDDFHKILNQFPQLLSSKTIKIKSDFYYYFGVAEYHTDCFDAAIDKLNNAFEINPTSPFLLDMYYYRGNAYYSLKQLSLAKNDYDSVGSLLNELYINTELYRNFYERRASTLNALSAGKCCI